MKRRLFSVAICAAAVFTFVGCGSKANYADGTYEGKSSVYESEDGTDEGNGYGVVTITIKDNVITDCTFQTFEPDGTLKDEEYGKEGGVIANKDYYNKAQKAVAACNEYANMLVANGRLDGMDAISGATKNYSQFEEAVLNALDKAKVE
ncbi:MAG: FMN-binding protein [Lachnospiraceae bacterium]|nr:FMN-binding protein [Lachnospiraceae bacterium]